MTEPEGFPDVSGLLAPLFDPHALADCTVALVLEHGYRGVVAEERTVTLRRRVRCTCPDGCKRCALVGWTLEEESLTVAIPAGVALGTTLRIAGKGDEFSLGMIQAIGDLLIELVSDGERAEELRAAQAAHEAQLAKVWAEDRRTKSFERRRAIFNVSLAIGIPLTLVVGVMAKEHLDKAPLGARCNRPTDCRSSDCLAAAPPPSATPAAPGRFIDSHVQVCTTACQSDDDCPSSMRCADVERAAFMPSPGEEPSRRVCVPR